MSTPTQRQLCVADSHLLPQFSKLFLFFCFLSLLTTSTQAQNAECETLFNVDDEPTLCETYPNFIPSITLGTNITKASQLIGDLTGNILIAGDFIVDRSFKFYNAVIKINPGRKIRVQPPYILAEEGYSNQFNKRIVFTIDNCDMFACDGLWKGIILTNQTDIITKSGTHIEDAEKAISAINTSAVTLTIYDTWFNRNIVGIYLSNSTFFNYDPVFRRFFGNDFTCNSPISGTFNGISEAGLYLRDVDIKLGAPPGQATFPSIFSDQEYGISVYGKTSTLRANSLEFHLCKKAGIFLEKGANLDLESSEFTEIFEKGIHAKLSKNIRIWECNFHLKYFGFLEEPNSVCVYLESFPLGGEVNILNSDFLTDNILPGTKYAKGIVLRGSEIGADLNFLVSDCNFDFTANRTEGIELDGIFPQSFYSEIRNNNFIFYNEELSHTWMTGINCTYGDKFNVHIIGNSFEGTNSQAEFVDCIRLSGSTGGFGNEVTDNRFNENFDNALEVSNGVAIFRSINTKICGNKDYFGTWSTFQFQSMNYHTMLQANDIYAGSDAVWYPANKTEMGIQYHHGNRFIPLWISFQPNVYKLYHPELDFGSSNDPVLSLFTVHQPVSYVDATTYEYDPLSLYHPISVLPDHNDWMHVDLGGTPVTGCIIQEPQPIVDTLDILIAKNIMDPVIPDSIDQWGGLWYLFGRLDREPSYANMSDDFGDFMNNNKNTVLGKLYKVEQSIQFALTKNSMLKANELENLNRKTSAELPKDSIANLATWTQQDRLNMNNKCDSLFEVKHDIHSLDADVTDDKTALLDSAFVLYNSINSQAIDYIDFHRRLYGYRIDLLKNGYSGISSTELDEIIDIAIDCPSEVGIAIYGLRGLLPECEIEGLTDLFQACDSFYHHEMPVPIAESNVAPYLNLDLTTAESALPVQHIMERVENVEVDQHSINYTEIRGMDGKFIASLKWEDQSMRLNNWLETTLNIPPGCYVLITTYNQKHVESKLYIKQ